MYYIVPRGQYLKSVRHNLEALTVCRLISFSPYCGLSEKFLVGDPHGSYKLERSDRKSILFCLLVSKICLSSNIRAVITTYMGFGQSIAGF